MKTKNRRTRNRRTRRTRTRGGLSIFKRWAGTGSAKVAPAPAPQHISHVTLQPLNKNGTPFHENGKTVLQTSGNKK